MSEKPDVITLQTSESYTSVHPNGPNPCNSGNPPALSAGRLTWHITNFEGEKKDRRKIDEKRIKNNQNRVANQVDCSSAWTLEASWTAWSRILRKSSQLSCILSDTVPCQHNTSQPKIAECFPESQCGNWNLQVKLKLKIWNWNPKSQCIHGPKNKFCVQHWGALI